jgi:hypothetical protein
VSHQLARLDVYAKVVERDGAEGRLRFTALPPEVAAYVEGMLA